MDETAPTSGRGPPLEGPRPPMVPERPTLEGLEAKWSARWQETGTYAFDRTVPRWGLLHRHPAPTVSGELHIGHVFSYTHTDTVARYRRMRGDEVFYPMGFDDNGLPTERRVQQYYGVRCDPGLRKDPDFVAPQTPAKQPVAISRPTSSPSAPGWPGRTRRSSRTCGGPSACRSTGTRPTPPSTPRSSRPQAAQDRSSAKRITGRPDGRSNRKRSPSPESLVQNAQSSA